MAVASALAFGKNNQADTAVDSVASEAPHAPQIGGAANIRDRDISKSFHQPAINRNVEMGFEFPAANELRYRAVQRERIEKIYVVGNEETGFLRVESWRADDLSFCAREKNNATAKSALQPVMLFGIEKNGED